MQRTPAARARGIRKFYGDTVALDGVDLDVDPGEVHGLVGPNGAGKTTLLGLLLGLAAPDEGTLEILGRTPGRSLAVVPGVAGFVDHPGLYPTLTARQNLAALGRLAGVHRLEVESALERVGLHEVADQRVRGFSMGMRQRLGLAAALMVRPRLLVLDEPVNGLDPAGRRHVQQLVADLAADGVAVVVSSHRMEDLAVLCREFTLLSAGRVAFSGPAEKLVAEAGEVEHTVVTSDGARALEVAARVEGLHVRPAYDAQPGGALVARGPDAALDAMVVALVGAGVALRELAPVVPPLEAAFLALTSPEIDPEVEPEQEPA